ncbi:hypothetical protein N431DRAFT_391519, partial [Stipitochalara longipes BDJ]
MPADWKNTVVRSLDREHFEFARERELIRPIVENQSANGDPIPCLFHLRSLAERLHMVSDLDQPTLAERFLTIWTVSDNDADWVRLIAHKNTRDFFKSNATFEGIRSRVSLNTMRFAPLSTKSKAVEVYDKQSVIGRIGANVKFLKGPDGVLRDQLQTFSASDCIIAVNSFDWLFEKKSGIKSMLEREVQMYVHHLRQDHRNRKDGLLR